MKMEDLFDPGYIELYHSGELGSRVERLGAQLASCDLCPQECRVNRLEGEVGFCHSAYLSIVASVCAHHGEEAALSGKKGSGTIFFGNCNMRCVYCGNYQISQDWKRQQSNEVDFHTLAENMLHLQNELGCHNINLVSPTHFVPQIVRAVLEAVPMGLKIPLVYNTGSFDSVKTLRELDGIMSIYLADLKYASDSRAEEFSQAPGYVARAREAIGEMYRQVGELEVDELGIARRGLIVRHLILPNGLAGSEDSLAWLAGELSPKVKVSIMSQYLPMHQAKRFPLLARTISASEHAAVLRLLDELGLENSWVQAYGDLPP